MKKQILILAILLITPFSPTVLRAQTVQHIIRGFVIDKQSDEGLDYATVRLMTSKDGDMLAGTNTGEDGSFTLRTTKNGKYLLRFSYLGYRSIYQDIELRLSTILDSVATNKTDTLDLGRILMYSDDYVLKAAIVRASVAKVQQVGDTTVFNADAYRTAEGATLEALVKQLPGAEVGDDGSITINGKKVNEILVNGKDFFKGDTETAMKNLPTNLVKKIKTYDKKSDYAEQTGIDDGEDSFVLDIMTRHDLNESWITNMDFAGGLDYKELRGLYSGKIFASRFTDRSRITFIGSHNNVGDNGFGGPRGMGGGGGGNGLNTNSMAAANFSWENDKKRFEAGRLELGGDLRYSRRENMTESKQASETFLTTQSHRRSFSDSHSWGESLSQSIGANLRLQWSPDSLTNLSFRPSYNWSKSRNNRESLSAQFDKTEDQTNNLFFEYEEVDDVLGRYFDLKKRDEKPGVTYEDFLVNLRDNLSRSQSYSHNVNGSLAVTRRLTGKQGRNLSLTANGGWSTSHNESYSLTKIQSRQGSLGNYSHTPSNSTHQYTTTPNKNWNVRVGSSYVEPLPHKLYAEFRYNYSFRFQDQNRSIYNLYDFGQTGDGLANIMSKYTGQTSFQTATYHPEADRTGYIDGIESTQMLNDYLSMPREDVYAAVRDAANSQYATYKYSNHSAQVGLRYNEGDIRLNAGVNFNPEHTIMDYERPSLGKKHITRSVFNVSPQVRLRWNMNRTRRLEFNFNANSSQPSMTNLLDVVDNSDPLRISTGNAGLKPSWTNNLRASFNDYNTDRQQNWMVNYSFQHTRNSISTLSVHELSTGRTFSAPQNISGNWNTSGGLSFSSGLGAEKLWNISTSTNVRYNHSTAYVATDSDEPVPTDITSQTLGEFFSRVLGKVNMSTGKSTNVSENLTISYRQTLWDVSANGRLNYQHSRSSLLTTGNMDVWGFNYGVSANVKLNCGFAVSTDFHVNSRRGYDVKSMNTNEILWNAQISQSFLKNKALTLSLQFYDILQQQSNISRNITATMRSESWNMALNSYAMLHVIYKFSAFAGQKGSAEGERTNPDEARERMQGSMPPGGMTDGAPMGGGRPAGRRY